MYVNLYSWHDILFLDDCGFNKEGAFHHVGYMLFVVDNKIPKMSISFICTNVSRANTASAFLCKQANKRPTPGSYCLGLSFAHVKPHVHLLRVVSVVVVYPCELCNLYTTTFG